MGGIHRRQYDREFKVSAVRLVVEGERKVSDVARHLGINENMLWRWKKEFEDDHKSPFPGSGHLKPEDEKLRRLERELAGPALSLPNMLVIRSIMGTKKTIVFVSLVIVMATITGMIYGAIF